MAKKSGLFTPEWLAAWEELLLKQVVIRSFLSIGNQEASIEVELMFLLKLPWDNEPEDDMAVYHAYFERNLGLNLKSPVTRLTAVSCKSEGLNGFLQGYHDRNICHRGILLPTFLLRPEVHMAVAQRLAVGDQQILPASHSLLAPWYGMVYEAIVAKSKEDGPEKSQWMLFKNRYRAFLYHQHVATIQNWLGEPVI